MTIVILPTYNVALERMEFKLLGGSLNSIASVAYICLSPESPSHERYKVLMLKYFSFTWIRLNNPLVPEGIINMTSITQELGLSRQEIISSNNNGTLIDVLCRRVRLLYIGY